MANYIEVMNLLIDGGEQGISDINAQDENGMTSLMIAIQRQDMEALELLLKENADLSIKDNQGKTAMDYVNKESKDGEYKIETLLKKYKKGGNKNRRTKTRRMNASISSGKKK
jgi:ankyrin repeat protein